MSGLKTGVLRDGLRNVSTGIGGFSPADIASLAHWYDATEISGSDGDAIGTWADQEGTDDLTQSTSSKKPTLRTSGINSKNILEFDGSDDVLDVDWSDISEPYMIFTVAKARSTGAVQTINDGLTKDEHRFLTNNGPWGIRQGTTQTGGTTDTSPHIFTQTYRSGSNNDELRVDASQTVNADSGNSSSTGLTVGNSGDENNPSPSDIGEVLFYDTEVSTSDRNDVESYLSDKWGITI